jgi:hypothetical protein
MIIKEAFPKQVVNHMTKLKCRPEPASFVCLSHGEFLEWESEPVAMVYLSHDNKIGGTHGVNSNNYHMI